MAKGDVLENRVPYSMDPAQQSAAFKIFHYNYYAYISGLYLYSTEDIATFGYVTTGDSETDRVLATEEREVILTIAQMVAIHAEGGGVRLRNPKDSAQIYELIYTHLSDWRHEIENNPYRRKAPLDDLRAMDEFARELHEYAKMYLTFNPMNTTLFARLEQVAHAYGGVGRPSVEAEIAQMEQDLSTRAHTSTVDVMSRTLRERERTFRNS